jgi:type II secretory pathway component GspD/PulD (secretin)
MTRLHPTTIVHPFLSHWILVLAGCLVLVGGVLPAQDSSSQDSSRTGSSRGGFGGGGFRRGGFGRGGFDRGGGRGLLEELSDDAIRTEVKITPDQQQKLDALAEAQRNNREQFGEFFQRMQGAQSEEERNQIRDEMRLRFEEVRKQADAQVKSVLTPEQAVRLDQLRLHRQGPAIFARDEAFAKEFGLTDTQLEQMKALGEERMAARMQLGRDASDEVRKKFDDEWGQKILAVLTPEQQSKWTQRLGPPPQPLVAPSATSQATPMATPAPVRSRPIFGEEAPAGTAPVVSFSSAPASGAAMENARATAEASGTSGNPSTAGGEKKLSFNFRYAPWGEVLKLFAEEAGLSLDLNAMPPGTFNYYDQHQYTPIEALDVLNGYLLPKGYCLVQRDDFLVCLNIDEPIPPSVVPNIAPSELDSRGRNELLTVVFPLEGVDVQQVAAEVNEMKGPQGKVVGLKSTNSILVTDIGSNLRRIRDLLLDVTARGGPDDITFKAYQVRNIPVADVEAIVRSLLGLGSTVANVSSSNESRGRDRRDSRYGPPQPPTASNDPSKAAHITTDGRTNQLLVTATLAQHQLVEEALKTIDVAGEASQFSPTSNRPFLKVYNVNSSDPREVTKTIDALMPGVVVNEDGRNGKIHILATPDQHRQVETLIAQMDGLGGGQQMAVIPLSSLDPVSVTSTIRSMFLKDGTAAPTIEPDLYGRQLMIRGNADQMAQIRTLLTQLGEDGSGQRSGADDRRIRTVPLSGRDPAELLPLLQRMWGANHVSPIRVVNPQQRGDVQLPSQPPPTTQTVPRSIPRQPPQDTDQNSVQTRPAVRAIPIRNIAQTTELPDVNTQRAESMFRLMDTNQDGMIDGEEWKSSSRLRPKFEAAGIDLQQPMPRDLFVQHYLNVNSGSNPPKPAKDLELERLLDAYLNAPPVTEQPASPAQSPSAQSPSTQVPVPESANPPTEVNVTVMGDELIISSSDPKKLDELQDLLERTMQALPPRVTWTVFTLQSADATEAANMLKLLFPGSAVSAASTTGSSSFLGSLSTGASSLGNSLADMTGLGTVGAAQQLRIIPDVRLNSLFVAGPAAQVREVEEMLKVLDSNGLAESMRDKVSRMIPIEYASAQEVYNIVKEVYKNYIDPPRVAENNNPLAMFAGGRGNRNEQAPPPAAKLAIGVDLNTSNLIVWADEPLYQEIHSLVQSLDQAAQEARRTVRVVTLENTNSAVVQSALGSLIPQVKVSVTGSRQTPAANSSNSSGTGSSSSGSSGSSGPSPDQFRQFFEQRMRERMQGGGESRSSSSPFGSSRFGRGGFGSRGGSGSDFGRSGRGR